MVVVGNEVIRNQVKRLKEQYIEAQNSNNMERMSQILYMVRSIKAGNNNFLPYQTKKG